MDFDVVTITCDSHLCHVGMVMATSLCRFGPTPIGHQGGMVSQGRLSKVYRTDNNLMTESNSNGRNFVLESCLHFYHGLNVFDHFDWFWQPLPLSYLDSSRVSALKIYQKDPEKSDETCQKCPRATSTVAFYATDAADILHWVLRDERFWQLANPSSGLVLQCFAIGHLRER